jgi:hypothetical protein
MLSNTKISAVALLVFGIYCSYITISKKPVPPPQPVKLTLAQEIKQLKQIYAVLRVNTGQPTGELNVINDPEINAWTDGKTITFTTGILEFINGNKDWEAMILSHEMAHYMLRHAQNTDPGNPTINKENQADRMGTYIMLRSGFDICEGRMFAIAIAKRFSVPLDQVQGDHPAWGFRFDAMSMPWCTPINIHVKPSYA